MPQIILVCNDRFAESGLTEDFFDTDWNHLDVKREKHGNSLKHVPKPTELDEMLLLAQELSKNTIF